jgi:long-chain acyl-CoA synthetase
VPSPLFHIGGTGYSLTAMGQGGHTVLVRDVDPVAMLGLIERHRVTHSFLVPAVVAMLVAALREQTAAGRAPDLSSLQLVAYGAAPMTDRGLREAMDAFGCGFLGVYGMTETAGSVLCLPAADHDPGGPRAGLLRSVGRALPWHEVEVRDPVTGEVCPPGEVGEIWVRSPQNMAGYWRQPGLSAQVLTDDGWLRSGDAAWTDAQGYVFVHDRLKDMIISGGENVYPAEVERVLARHPAVGEVVVIGVPHERWGETVKAVVVPRDGAAPDAAELTGELIALARTELARYKCPTSVDVVDELPRNASGKVLKRVLRAPFWAGAEAAP